MTALQRLRERFWFLPAVLCPVATFVAELLFRVDRTGERSVPAWAEVLLYRAGESGSRDVLGAIAASSLAVAGTTLLEEAFERAHHHGHEEFAAGAREAVRELTRV